MKILHINTNSNGGAAKACTRINEALNEKNIDSDVLVLNNKNDKFKTYKMSPAEKIFHTIYKIRKKALRFSFFIKKENLVSFPDTKIKIQQNDIYKNADIINLHWVANFLDYRFFSQNKKPVVWTLHDLEPFSGGNHYSYKTNILNKLIFRYKKYFLLKNKVSINIVCPSRWIMEKSKNSELFGSLLHHHIPNPFNPNIFKRYNKEDTRKEFEIPNEKKVILFVSDSINDKRKGFNILIDSFNLLKDDNILLCSVGSNKNKLENKNYLDLGYINNEETMAKIYSMADLFVISSLEDNLPNTMIESLMCGTPVIGFEIGGIKETIENNVNGLLTEEISPDSLLKIIKEGINKKFDNEKIRDNAINKYSYSVIAKKYIDLYNKIQ